MTVTTLDPRTALIVIDLQQGIVPRPAPPPIERVVENAVMLVEAFRRAGRLVVLVNVAGGAPGRTEQPRPSIQLPPGWTDLIPELAAQAGDHLVTKHTRSAFTNTGLDAHLKGLGVTQVVITGIATSSGVEVTAVQAFELGFNVTLATDAMFDPRTEAHAYSLANVFPRIGETGATPDIIALLEKGGPA
jgi:nicotinamidase-related amidase